MAPPFKKQDKEDPELRERLERLIYSALKYQYKAYGFILDEEGWLGVDTLIDRINFLENEDLLTRSTLIKLVENNPKFSLNFFKTQIKANEIKDDSLVTIRRSIPPVRVYLILNKNCKREGDEIVPCNGHDKIKLVASVDRNIDANRVLRVNSELMFAAGYIFYRSDKNDWFTARVPIRFVSRFTR